MRLLHQLSRPRHSIGDAALSGGRFILFPGATERKRDLPYWTIEQNSDPESWVEQANSERTISHKTRGMGCSGTPSLSDDRA